MAVIYICGSIEHLMSSRTNDWQSQVEMVEEAIYDTASRHDSTENKTQVARNFRDWNGGKFYQAGTMIDGNQYGYRSGCVATLEINPSSALCQLISSIDDDLSSCLDRLIEIA